MHMQLFWPFDSSPILLCSDDPKRGNSCLNSTFDNIFFLTWIFFYSYPEVGCVLVCKRQDFCLFTSANHCSKKLRQYFLLFPNRNKILIISTPPLLAGIGSFQTSGTNLLNQMVFIARSSSTPTPNFMLVMFVLDSLSQGLHVAVEFALYSLANMTLM